MIETDAQARKAIYANLVSTKKGMTEDDSSQSEREREKDSTPKR